MNQLWVWSTVVQATSLLMIAVFFAALSRSVQLLEVVGVVQRRRAGVGEEEFAPWIMGPVM